MKILWDVTFCIFYMWRFEQQRHPWGLSAPRCTHIREPALLLAGNFLLRYFSPSGAAGLLNQRLTVSDKLWDSTAERVLKRCRTPSPNCCISIKIIIIIKRRWVSYQCRCGLLFRFHLSALISILSAQTKEKKADKTDFHLYQGLLTPLWYCKKPLEWAREKIFPF